MKRIKKVEKEFLFSLGLKYCPKCQEIKEIKKFSKYTKANDRLQFKCKECNKEHQKEYSKSKKFKESNKKSKNRPEQKHRDRLRVKTNKHLGPAKQFNCMICNKQGEEYHHFSYEDDYKVNTVVLCTKCHKKLHRGAGVK